MKIKLNVLHNKQLYKQFNFLDNDVLTIENIADFEEFMFQNKTRKNNNVKNDNDNFRFKRVKKNLKSFQDLINLIGYNKNDIKGYFLDYSSYVNIFLYFKNMDEILWMVQDTCEARGDEKINSLNEAINFLKNEDVVISEIIEFNINEIEWQQLLSKYEKNKKCN